jgi:ligand-binding sensor domain-containing protein
MESDGQIQAVRPDSARLGSLDPALVADAREDGEGNCWVIHQNGLLEKIDGIRHRVVYSTTVLEKSFSRRPITCNLFIDRQNDLWISAEGSFKGTYCFHPATGSLRHLSQEQPAAGKLSSDLIYTAIQDSKGRIWLATDHGGVDIIDKKDWSVTTPSDIMKTTGRAWRRTASPVSIKRQYWRHVAGHVQERDQLLSSKRPAIPSSIGISPNNPGSLSYNDVNNFAEDTAGRIWIGSNGGGLIYFDRKHKPSTNTCTILPIRQQFVQ